MLAVFDREVFSALMRRTNAEKVLAVELLGRCGMIQRSKADWPVFRQSGSAERRVPGLFLVPRRQMCQRTLESALQRVTNRSRVLCISVDVRRPGRLRLNFEEEVYV